MITIMSSVAELRDEILAAIARHPKSSIVPTIGTRCSCGAEPYDKHVNELVDRIIVRKTIDVETKEYHG